MATSKTGKKTSGGSPRSYSEVYKSSATAGAPPVQTTAPVATSQSATTKSVSTKAVAPVMSGSDTVDWWGEYGYVLSDLRYLGLVTAGLLVGIIVIGLLLL